MRGTTGGDDAAMLGRVRAVLDESVAQLDPTARQRLRSARRAALAIAAPARAVRRWPLFAAAASAAVLLLAVAVLVQGPVEAPGGPSLALAEDPAMLEWLLGEAAAEPAGDADFYAWLDELERARAGGVADAG